MAEQTDAICMALSVDVDPKTFRRALRRAKLQWHVPNARWIVAVGSPEHGDMDRVLTDLRNR